MGKISVPPRILGFASVVAALHKAFQRKTQVPQKPGIQVTNRLLRSGISELFCQREHF